MADLITDTREVYKANADWVNSHSRIAQCANRLRKADHRLHSHIVPGRYTHPRNHMVYPFYRLSQLGYFVLLAQLPAPHGVRAFVTEALYLKL